MGQTIYKELLMPAGGEELYREPRSVDRLMAKLQSQREAALDSLAAFFPMCLQPSHVKSVLKSHLASSLVTSPLEQLWPAWVARDSAVFLLLTSYFLLLTSYFLLLTGAPPFADRPVVHRAEHVPSGEQAR